MKQQEPQEPKNPKDHGAEAGEALRQRAITIADKATKRYTARGELRKRGTARDRSRKVSEEQWDWLIDRIACGDTDANLARVLGVNVSAIGDKRDRDPEFAQRYFNALQSAYITIAQETRDVARGVEGYSTGDVKRDRLIVETDLKLAKAFASKIFGDKVQVDQRTITINMKPDEMDW